MEQLRHKKEFFHDIASTVIKVSRWAEATSISSRLLYLWHV